MKQSKPRPTTARFTTDECKVILMAMNYCHRHNVFVGEGDVTVTRAYGIKAKLRHRIDQETNKLLQELIDESEIPLPPLSEQY